ncbi:ATP-binding protein [uncultured Nocardioides sp.]|uniref:ATP-binding protein n=1 Tax=uncultured Nocardioides sp. TaxID=198441 RepID=UPI00262C2808|nr:ATP-binding protein [uncultured Nocardioides sp.]
MTHAELYRLVVESSADGLWVLDARGRTVFANQRLADMMRTDRAALTGRDHAEFLDAEGREQWTARLARGEPPSHPVECRFVRGDRTTAWFLVTEAHLPGPEGGNILLSLNDFDERRRLEAALEANRQELLEAHRVAGLGSWTADLTTDTLTLSSTFVELIEQPTCPTTRSWGDTLDALQPASRTAVDEAVGALGRGEADTRTIDLRSQPTGPERWLRVRVVAHRQDRRLVGLSGTVQDVTGIHQSETALRDLVSQNELMRAVAVAANASQSLGEALTACGPLVVGHDGWRRARTFDPDDALTEWPLSFGTGSVPHDPDVPDRERRVARSALGATGPVWDEETRTTVACAITAAGRPVAVIVMSSDSPVGDHDTVSDMVTRVVAQLSSVAEREATAHELAAARDAAEEASRQKSEFLATMSHEIRTPLNGVIGLNDLLRTTTLDEHQDRLVSGVGASGRALLGLVDDILDFSKIEAGQLLLETIDVDLRAVLDDVVAMTAETARARRVEVVWHCDRDVPALVRSDRVRLTQVVSNLVSNAVKFTEDGEVVVSLRAVGPTGPTVPLLLEVSDTGVGIDPSRVRSIFEPFIQADATTTREYGGTGLGLAIVREIVGALGGEAGVRSEPGSGSTFWCRLPLAPTPGARGTVADLAGRRARVVDDRMTRREALVDRLVHWGMDADGVDPADPADPAESAGAVDVVLLGPGVRRSPAEGSSPAAPVVHLLEPGEVLPEAGAGVRTLGVEQPVTGDRLRHVLVAAVHGTDPAGQHAPRPGPATHPGGDRGTGRAPEARGAGGRRGRVLIVEDTPVNQLVAEGILSALGYDSESVDDGVRALERLAADPASDPAFDLVLMDVQMPRMDGYATARAIREREARSGARRLPIVAMTAAAVTGERERCLEAGMDDFLTKPVSPPHLATVLADQLPGAGGDPAPPACDTAPAVAPETTGTVSVVQADEAPVDLTEHLEHLDLERLDMLRDLDPGNTSYVDRVIGNFVRKTPDLHTRIADGIEAGDAAAVTATAHRLRGSALNLGVPQVAETAFALELAGERGDLAPAPALLATLTGRLERGRDAVLAYRRSYGGAADT